MPPGGSGRDFEADSEVELSSDVSAEDDRGEEDEGEEEREEEGEEGRGGPGTGIGMLRESEEFRAISSSCCRNSSSISPFEKSFEMRFRVEIFPFPFFFFSDSSGPPFGFLSFCCKEMER